MHKIRGFSIQKFDGKNFQLWKYQIEIVFRAENMTNLFNGTATAIWKRLKKIHEQRSAINKITLKRQSFNYQMSESVNIAQHLRKNQAKKVTYTDKIAKVLGPSNEMWKPCNSMGFVR